MDTLSRVFLTLELWEQVFYALPKSDGKGSRSGTREFRRPNNSDRPLSARLALDRTKHDGNLRSPGLARPRERARGNRALGRTPRGPRDDPGRENLLSTARSRESVTGVEGLQSTHPIPRLGLAGRRFPIV